MTPPIANAPALDTWTNLSGFAQLRAQARSDGGKAALPVVAKQFEAIFTQMMLKSMREANASIGSGYADSDAGNSYQDMADHQLALTLANGKNGLGIAQMLIRQLGGKEQAAQPADGTPPTTVLSGTAAITNANVRALLQLGAAPGAACGAVPPRCWGWWWCSPSSRSRCWHRGFRPWTRWPPAGAPSARGRRRNTGSEPTRSAATCSRA